MRPSFVIALAALIGCAGDATSPRFSIPAASDMPQVQVADSISYLSAPPPGIPALVPRRDTLYFNLVEPTTCSSTVVQAGARNDSLVVTLRHAPLPEIPCPPSGFVFVQGNVPGRPAGVVHVFVTDQAIVGVQETRTLLDTGTVQFTTLPPAS